MNEMFWEMLLPEHRDTIREDANKVGIKLIVGSAVN